MKEGVNKEEANKALYISGAVIALILIALFTNGFGLLNNAGGGGGNNGAFIPLSPGIAPVLGQADAPVTIYEFSDFSCSACKLASGVDFLSNPGYNAPVPGIKKNYVETGKAKFVFKYFPGHGTGSAAHLVGWCLDDQNLFWQYHDKAFDQQVSTGSTGKMKDIAETLGANMEQLDECLSSRKYNHLLQDDQAMGSSNGVRGTPAFFVNGQPVSGAVPYETIAATIESELAKTGFAG